MKKLLTAMLVMLLALGAGACGGDDDGDGGADTGATVETQPAAERVNVSETEFELSPANPRIDQPGLVEFRVSNKGKIVHALEVEGPDGEVETGQIQPGATDTLQVDLSKAGSYEWYCPIGNHRQLGMEGEIRVGGSSSKSGTTGNDDTRTTETQTTETQTTPTTGTPTTESEGGDDTGGSGSGGSGSGSGGSGGSGTGGSGGSGY